MNKPLDKKAVICDVTATRPDAPILVGVDIKVVPAGVIMRRGLRLLRVALVISPRVPFANESNEDLIDLANWPHQVEARIATKTIITVSSLPTAFDPSKGRPTPAADHSTQVRFRRVGGDSTAAPAIAKKLERINRCWQTLVGLADPFHQHTPWEALHYLYCRPLAGASGGVRQRATNLTNREIVGVPRGDMAVFLQSWRARVVLGRLAKDHTLKIEPGCNPTEILRDWLLTESNLKEMALHLPELIPDDVRNILEQVRKSAATIKKARRDYLEASTSQTALEVLDNVCTPDLFCEKPFSVVAPIAAEKELAIHKIFGRHRLLHEAQLELDEILKPQYAENAGADTVKPIDEIPWQPKQALDEINDTAYREAVGAVERKLFALQAIPSLARVFRFVIDAEVVLGDLPPTACEPISGKQPQDTMMQSLAQLAPARLLEADSVDRDAESDDDQLPSTEETQPVTHYLYLSYSTGAVRQPWTTTKLRFPTGKAAAVARVTGHFLPCTFEELELAALLIAGAADRGGADDVNAVRLCQGPDGRPLPRYMLPAMRDGRLLQFDGVLDLGAGRRHPDPAKRAPRYDIISLDVVGAMETQAAVVRAARKRGLAPNQLIPARPTFHTVGLALIDRWRAAAVTGATADMEFREKLRDGSSPVVFDANALTTGYRIDVGVRQRSLPGSLHRWRPLGNRIVTYVYPSDPELIEEELTRLGYARRTEDRVRLDSTPIVPAARASGEKRYPEEVLAVWEGDPLGVQCVRDSSGENVSIDIDPAQDLAISRTYELPDADEAGFRIPSLTFGRRYRMGLRADFLGGITLPLRRARAIYEEAFGGLLALPEAPVPAEGKWTPGSPDHERVSGRRFLRHERILPPTLTVPRQEVEAARRAGGKRLRDQSATEAIVRTATATSAPSGQLDTPSVQRIVVPPSVPQDFAQRHGVLFPDRVLRGKRKFADKKERNVVLPADGLRNVDYGAEHGGFPWRTVDNKVQDHRKLEGADSISSSQRGNDPVFVVHKTEDVDHLRRREPYFPDPAADLLVVALRHRDITTPGANFGADPDERPVNAYLPGRPAVVSFAHSDLPYPHAVPVVLNVIRAPNPHPRKRADQSHERIVKARGTEGRLVADGFKSEPINPHMITIGQVPARQVTIELTAGEEYEADVWCVPTVDHLDAWFDVVETASMVAIVNHCLSDAGAFKDADAACRRGLATLLGPARRTGAWPTEFAHFYRILNEAGADRLQSRSCTVGGLLAANGDLRRGLAETIHRYMLRRPIPEIAAVRTLRLAHAVSAPNYRPEFLPRDDVEHNQNLRNVGLDVIRKSSPAKVGEGEATESGNERAKFIAAHPVDTWHTDAAGDAATHERKATALLVGGRIGVDLDTCDTATIIAEMAHPYTSIFDDVRIGRRVDSIELVADGKAPQRMHYGFVVDPATHRVDFTRQQVVLTRISGLQLPAKLAERRDGVEPVDLLFEDSVGGDDASPTANPTANAIRRADISFVPNDDKARMMTLRIEAESRFFSDFEYAAPERDGHGRPVASNPLLNPAELNLPPEQRRWRTARTSSTLQAKLWIPATKRPDPIDPQSVLPVFVWHKERVAGQRIVERRMIARLRFRRPWYSSGEGERLGIVLWPPEIFSQPQWKDDFPKELASKDGKAFIEKELKKGTGFITRSGTDPIRLGGSPTQGLFVAREAFRYERSNDPDGHGVVEVGRVAMPLPLAETGGEQQTLDVSLLTFKPLFDPVDECWYVDVEIAARDMPDGWMRFGLVRYQPHAMKGEHVSEPTVAWTQILPARRARVETSDTGNGTQSVVLTVEGVGSLASEPDSDLSSADVDLMQRPVLRVVVFRKSHPSTDVLPTGAASEATEISLLRDKDGPLVFDNTGRGYVRPKRGDSGLVWVCKFTLPKPEEEGSYSVLLEEIDLRPPATKSELTLIESGPRFIATFDI